MIRHASAVVIVLILNSTPLFGQSAPNAASELIVNAAAADVYKSPTVASAVIGKVRGGTALEIRRNLGSWVEVPWPGAGSGVAFVHVNAGTIARRSAAGPSNGAEAAVAQIHAVAAAATAASAANSNGRASAGQSGAMSQTGTQAPSYVALPQHRIGMGALMNPSQPRFGVTARTWWQHGLGVQFHVSRPQLESADGRLLASTQFAPSVLYAMPDAVTNAVWLRPYAGGGPRFYRANRETAIGYETFGGAEATFAAMPQFALSADLGYRWARPSFDGFEPNRIGFSLAAHWYLK